MIVNIFFTLLRYLRYLGLGAHQIFSNTYILLAFFPFSMLRFLSIASVNIELSWIPYCGLIRRIKKGDVSNYALLKKITKTRYVIYVIYYI